MVKFGKIFLCTVFILVFNFSLKAQKIEASLSLHKKEPQPEWIEYSYTDKGLVTIANTSRFSSRSKSIFKYNENFEREWAKEIFNGNGKNSVIHLQIIGESILIFFREDIPKAKNYKVYFSQYDLDGNEIQEQQEVCTLNNGKTGEDRLYFTTSTNRNKMLMFIMKDKNRENEEFSYFVFDKDSPKLQEQKILLNYPDNKITVKQALISNQGNLVILAKYYEMNKVKSPYDYEFILINYNDSTQQTSETKIKTGGKYVVDLFAKIDNEENIYCAGFYSEKNTYSLKGVVFKKYELQSQIEKISTIEAFPQDFLANFLTQKQIQKGRELQDFYMDKMYLGSDGGVLLLAENFYVSTYSNFNYSFSYYGTPNYTTMYNFGEVIAISVSGNGEINWTSVLKKYQQGSSKLELSYFPVVTSSGIWIYYKTYKKKLGTNIYGSLIDHEGAIYKSKPLFAEYQKFVTFYRPYCEQISNNEALFLYYQQKKKAFNITKVSFD